MVYTGQKPKRLMMSHFSSLANLGWQAFFQQQLSLDEWDEAIPARVVEQYKSEITLATESGIFNIPLLAHCSDERS